MKARPEEIDALFTRLDTSGDGDLDLNECKAALVKLREMAAEESAVATQLESRVGVLAKVAKAAQKEAAAALEAFDPDWKLDSLA